MPLPMNLGLVGQPNTGKSSLFNRLTGARQHVGNWPGKTVEHKSGRLVHDGREYILVDLPGTYSLTSASPEEVISRDFVVSGEADAILVIIDASQLRRSMYMVAEMAGLDVPVIAVMNMVDVAEDSGVRVDAGILADRLGVPVIPTVASRGLGLDQLMADVAGEKAVPVSPDAMDRHFSEALGKPYSSLKNLLSDFDFSCFSVPWLAARLLENDSEAREMVRGGVPAETWEEVETLLADSGISARETAAARFAWIDEQLAGAVERPAAGDTPTISGFDRLATHHVFGKILAALILFLGFAVGMAITVPAMWGIIYAGLPAITRGLGGFMAEAGVAPWLTTLINEALIPGAGMALYMGFFIFGVSFVFSLIEDVGYMARIAYVYDGLMGKLGLHGKAIMPFILGFGCNIAGTAGTRVIDSWSQRIVAIATSFVVPCLGIWGAVGLMGSLFFGMNTLWIILALFATAVLHMKFTSWIFGKKLIKDYDYSGMVMELPPYHKPNWKAILGRVWSRIRIVVSKAFSVIILISVVMWLLSFSRDGNVENSIIYPIGKFLEPFSMIFGLDWRLFIAFLVAALGKEAALGVMAVLFGVGSGMSSFAGAMISGGIQYSTEGFAGALASSVSPASALAFIFAFFFNIPCMATLATARAELHSAKWTWTIAIYYLVVALLVGGAAYYVGLLIF